MEQIQRQHRQRDGQLPGHGHGVGELKPGLKRRVGEVGMDPGSGGLGRVEQVGRIGSAGKGQSHGGMAVEKVLERHGAFSFQRRVTDQVFS